MQTEYLKTENRVGSNLPQQSVEEPKHEGGAATTGAALASIGAGSFTTFWTWRANGVHPKVNFTHPAITANSRVFVSISEFNSDATINRFIGDARMAVYNVAPFNGGFQAWVDISFDTALNVRFDVLVDP